MDFQTNYFNLILIIVEFAKFEFSNACIINLLVCTSNTSITGSYASESISYVRQPPQVDSSRKSSHMSVKSSRLLHWKSTPSQLRINFALSEVKSMNLSDSQVWKAGGHVIQGRWPFVYPCDGKERRRHHSLTRGPSARCHHGQSSSDHKTTEG